MSPPTSSRLQRQAWPSDMPGGGLGAARPTAGRVERQSAGVNCSSQEWRGSGVSQAGEPPSRESQPPIGSLYSLNKNLNVLWEWST